jgi:hypothetical protein
MFSRIFQFSQVLPAIINARWGKGHCLFGGRQAENALLAKLKMCVVLQQVMLIVTTVVHTVEHIFF